jgi:DNA-binding protein HU-beta
MRGFRAKSSLLFRGISAKWHCLIWPDVVGSSKYHYTGGFDMAGKVMTKSQLVSHLAEKANVTKSVISTVLETLSNTAVVETKKNGQFVIPGVGKLVKSQRKARMGRNPQTGAAIKIPAKTVVKFRVAKACKDAVVPPKK